MISHEKSAKIKNRRSSRHVLLKSTWRDDRRFASWRIIITDIQSGNIGGLAGRNQSLPKFAIFALDSSHFSSPTLWGVFPLDSENPGRELWGTPPNPSSNWFANNMIIDWIVLLVKCQFRNACILNHGTIITICRSWSLYRDTKRLQLNP